MFTTDRVTQERASTRDWRPTASSEVLRARAELLTRIRSFFGERGVLEVDTPQRALGRIPEANIATVACDGGLLLPSPEPYLKRLLAADYGDVYQLAHVFRAGERGRNHAEEFLLCEWYRVDRDDDALMGETAELVERCGGPPAATGERTSFEQVFERHAGVHPLASAGELAAAARAQGVAPAEGGDDARADYWRDLLMALLVQPRLGGDAPLFVTGFPAADSPLAEPDPDDPRYARRFELFWRGVELANGCVERRDTTTLDPQTTDPRFCAAMQAGLPFCSGVALGVDRLLMLLCGAGTVAQVQPFADG